MKRIRSVAFVAIALSFLVMPTTMGEKQAITPLEDPSNWPAGCRMPYGYTAACGYSASTAGGECACRESDVQTTLCMKSKAGTGCGIYETANDPCCKASSGL